ncbi:MAG: DNA repair protein RecO [Halioglobus sp.]|nr:DNA repair protein RecO [Halioglobus sp.]
MRVQLQPAYVIHRRPYRDSSALLDVFTAEYGRVGLIARGVRRGSRSAGKAALLQPFRPLLLSFSGRAELKTLMAIEPANALSPLRGSRLFSGLYMNELLIRLLHRDDPYPGLFAAYGMTLTALGGFAPVDPLLRRFELDLLENLGYRLVLDTDSGSGKLVRADARYRYEPGRGLIACDGPAVGTVFAGSDLLAMARGDFAGAVRLPARRLLRAALAVHLGDMPLRSRELFSSARR